MQNLLDSLDQAITTYKRRSFELSPAPYNHSIALKELYMACREKVVLRFKFGNKWNDLWLNNKDHFDPTPKKDQVLEFQENVQMLIYFDILRVTVESLLRGQQLKEGDYSIMQLDEVKREWHSITDFKQDHKTVLIDIILS